MTLAAPFSADFKNLETTCVIKLKDNEIPFEFDEIEIDGNLWDEYFTWRFTESSNRKCLFAFIEFPGFDSIELEYYFDAYINIKDYQNSVLEIFYDVGTSRAWNGTITERVEFNVYRKQPDSYSNSSNDFYNYNFAIYDIEDGQSYVWEWKNDVINTDCVYISYSYTSYWRYMFGKFFVIIFLPVGLLILIIIVVFLRRRRKRKIKENFID